MKEKLEGVAEPVKIGQVMQNRRGILKLMGLGAITASALLMAKTPRAELKRLLGSGKLSPLPPNFLSSRPEAMPKDPEAMADYQIEQFGLNRETLAKYSLLNEKTTELFRFYNEHAVLLLPSEYADEHKKEWGLNYNEPFLLNPEAKEKIKEDQLGFGLLHWKDRDANGHGSVFVRDDVLSCSEFLSQDWRAIMLYESLEWLKQKLEYRAKRWVASGSYGDRDFYEDMAYKKEVDLPLAFEILEAWKPDDMNKLIAEAGPLLASLTDDPPYDENDLFSTKRARQIFALIRDSFDLPLARQEHRVTLTQINHESAQVLLRAIFFLHSKKKDPDYQSIPYEPSLMIQRLSAHNL